MHHNFNHNYLMQHGCSRTNEHSIQKRKKNKHRFYFEIVVMSTKKMKMEFAYVKKMSTVFILPGFLSGFLFMH